MTVLGIGAGAGAGAGAGFDTGTGAGVGAGVGLGVGIETGGVERVGVEEPDPLELPLELPPELPDDPFEPEPHVLLLLSLEGELTRNGFLSGSTGGSYGFGVFVVVSVAVFSPFTIGCAPPLVG